jgi:hypothetical protein
VGGSFDNSFIFQDDCFKSPAPSEPSHGHATDSVSVASVPPPYPSRPTDTHQERAATENDICPLPPAYIPKSWGFAGAGEITVLVPI